MAITTRLHLTGDSARSCWCKPRFFRVCPECERPGQMIGEGCWRCMSSEHTGLIAATHADTWETVVVVHNPEAQWKPN